MALMQAPENSGISKNFLVLCAMLMAFVLLVLFVFLWYNVQIKTIEKKIEKIPQTSSLQHTNPHLKTKL